MNEDNEEPYFDCAFIRLLNATSDTIARRGTYVPLSLVNEDGTIKKSHQFSETQLYRSHLGNKPGLLKPGDIIKVYGEGGFYRGEPEFIDQEGIIEDGKEMNIIGYDLSLATPDYKSNISSFWDEWHENHYVKFYAKKTGDTRVRDHEGKQIQTYDTDGYDYLSLPGSNGDILEITGLNTQRDSTRLFRCDTVTLATNGYPPFSWINQPTDTPTSGEPVNLTATAGDPDGTVESVQFFYRHSSDNRSWNLWNSIFSDNTAPWCAAFSFPDGCGYYEFYSVATDNVSNVEDAPLYADVSITRVLLGDLDYDGDVDLADLAQLLGNYGTTSGATYDMGDLDGDEDIDQSDLVILLTNYGMGT